MTSSSMWARRSTCQRTREVRPHLSADGRTPLNCGRLGADGKFQNVTVATNSPSSFSPRRSVKKPRAEEPPRRLCRSPEAMEQFHDGQHVWLRSRAVDQYLRADDDDGSGVSLHQDRASMHAAWAVHILHVPGGAGDILMLHSAANGRYLAATATGWAGNGVTLRDLDQLPSRTVGWFAVRSEFAGDDVLLRHTSGRFLRVDDRNLWWNNIGVSVDVFNGRRPYMRQWVVEAIPPRESIPRLPIPTPRAFFSVRIWYVRASPLGIFLPTAWRPLSFNGRSVFYLRNRLASQLGIREASDVIMCVQAGCFGRLTPLVTDLPSNNVPNKIVVLTAGTIAANRLSHPNVLHAA